MRSGFFSAKAWNLCGSQASWANIDPDAAEFESGHRPAADFCAVAAAGVQGFAFEFRHESWFKRSGVRDLRTKKRGAVLGGERERLLCQSGDGGLSVLQVSRARIQHGPIFRRWRKELKEQSKEREVFAFFKTRSAGKAR